MLPVAVEIATKKGIVVLLGSPHGATSHLRPYDIHKRGITIVGAQAPLQPYMIRAGEPHLLEPNRLMLDFMAQGRLHIAPLMTHTYDAGRAETAYAGLQHEQESHLGVLLDLQKW
jgi:threonine dehydrogenase-like Zn-dependent dehydrogenase